MRDSTDHRTFAGELSFLRPVSFCSGVFFAALISASLIFSGGAAFAQEAAEEKPTTAAAAPAPEAQESESALRIELNRLEPQGANCRAYFLIENPGTASYGSLKLDLFALDKEGIIAKRLAVDIAPIQSKKTSVKVFEFPELACDRFGRVLLNDVLACQDGAGMKNDCVDRIETAARGAVPFVK